MCVCVCVWVGVGVWVCGCVGVGVCLARVDLSSEIKSQDTAYFTLTSALQLQHYPALQRLLP